MVGLGIDVGGTFTDAVVYEIAQNKLLAKAKALTTYYNLVCGITEALENLPSGFLKLVELTVLSTTLATNAIVEGRERKTGVLVFSPWKWEENYFNNIPLINVPGAVSIEGEIMVPLDKDALDAAVDYLVQSEKCDVIVIAGYALQRNNNFVRTIKKLIFKKYPSLTIFASNEITDELNMYDAAETAVANACLIPLITELLNSVKAVLAQHNISAKLMIMKGDGSIITEEYAREKPIETILSGPAASVVGAKVLTRKKDGIILDIGGTTTDCAILQRGSPKLLKNGIKAKRGNISVKAIDITTIGLGGDSRLDFTQEHNITVGPERSIPIAYLAHKYPSAKRKLYDLDEASISYSKDASSLDFWMLSNPDLPVMNAREQEIIHLLSDEPMRTEEILKKLKVVAKCFLPLEDMRIRGIIKRASLTPTDLFHIEGSFSRWDNKAAERALEIFARMLGKTTEETFAEIFKTITHKLFCLITSHTIAETSESRNDFLKNNANLITEEAFYNKNKVLKITFNLRHPIIAIGAPAELFIRPIKKHLKAKLIVPENADVANAIGAITSEIIIKEKISLVPISDGNKINYISAPYTIHSSDDINKMSKQAATFLKKLLAQKARKAGIHPSKIKLSVTEKKASSSDGTNLIVERTIEGCIKQHILGENFACR